MTSALRPLLVLSCVAYCTVWHWRFLASRAEKTTTADVLVPVTKSGHARHAAQPKDYMSREKMRTVEVESAQHGRSRELLRQRKQPDKQQGPQEFFVQRSAHSKPADSGH